LAEEFSQAAAATGVAAAHDDASGRGALSQHHGMPESQMWGTGRRTLPGTNIPNAATPGARQRMAANEERGMKYHLRFAQRGRCRWVASILLMAERLLALFSPEQRRIIRRADASGAGWGRR